MAATSIITIIQAVNQAGLGPEMGAGLPAAAQSNSTLVKLTSAPETKTLPKFQNAPCSPT